MLNDSDTMIAWGEEMLESGDYTRQDLINWLCWCDPNGCYRDADCLAEFDCIASFDELECIFKRKMLED